MGGGSRLSRGFFFGPTFRLAFATPRLRNHLFACIAHIREMVFDAGFDTATPRLKYLRNSF
jgi:hypothetical protein